MKRHKAPGMSGLVPEMIQSTGDIGTQWLVDIGFMSWKCEIRLYSRGLEVK